MRNSPFISAVTITVRIPIIHFLQSHKVRLTELMISFRNELTYVQEQIVDFKNSSIRVSVWQRFTKTFTYRKVSDFLNETKDQNLS